jgi:hypothetical protein
MIRTVKILFCEDDHGSGDITFPDIPDLDAQSFIQPLGIGALRRAAKAAGWKRIMKADYCPDCVACIDERAKILQEESESK